jgi:hypothetical protein
VFIILVADCSLLTVIWTVTRVNWLRARARHQRWEEEIQLLQHEMTWTQLWFEQQQQMWKKRHRSTISQMCKGHEVYAAKQVWVWSQFLHDARNSFADTVEGG